MSDIQTAALNRALSILNAIKVPYAVMHNGVKHGTLEVAPDKSAAPRFQNLKKHDYLAKLQAAKVGDVLTFKVDSNAEGESLRGSISAAGIRMFGLGSILTEFHRDTDGIVQGLIVSKP